jgi:hypothetical protein
VIYSHHYIIDMSYTQIDNQVTSRLAGERDRWVTYSHHHIIDMAYTQIENQVTGRLAGDRDRWVIYSHHYIIDMIYSHHHIIYMAYTQIDNLVTGRLAQDKWYILSTHFIHGSPSSPRHHYIRFCIKTQFLHSQNLYCICPGDARQ